MPGGGVGVFFVLFSCSHLVQVPEKEELSPACGGAANVTKKVAVVVPEDSVEAQNHLDKIQDRGSSQEKSGLV